jgi:hypothetical protein
LEKEQQKIQAEMDRTYRAYIDDKISSDEFGLRYNPLETQKKQLGEQIPQVQGEIDFLKIKFISSDQILTEAKDLYSRWPSLEPEAKRKIIENITDRISIGKDDVTIDLCYLPSSSQMMVDRQRDFRDSLLRLTCRGADERC